MIRSIAALVALSARGGIANVTAATAPLPKGTPPDTRCRERAAGIDTITLAPDRGQTIERGIGPDGKPRNGPTTNATSALA